MWVHSLSYLGKAAVYLCSLAIAFTIVANAFLMLNRYSKDYTSERLLDTTRLVNDKYDGYIDKDITGTELVELAYQNKDNVICIVVFPAKSKGNRSVYWGYPIEGYYTDRVATAYSIDTAKGCYIADIRSRNQYSRPIIDLPSFNYEGSDFYIPPNSLYKVSVIQDTEGYFVGFVCQEYGEWNSDEGYMMYTDN